MPHFVYPILLVVIVKLCWAYYHRMKAQRLQKEIEAARTFKELIDSNLSNEAVARILGEMNKK